MPSGRTAAEMRVIHSLRNSPFLRRLSRYEEARAFMTASFAVLKSLLRPPQYPLASFIILCRRSRLRVPFLDLGMDQNLLLPLIRRIFRSLLLLAEWRSCAPSTCPHRA